MSFVLASLLLVVSLVCWLGQVITLLAPDLAVRLSLCEAETDVEPSYWADIRGEALWDSMTLWTMVAAAALLLAGRAEWALFGLVGGGMYLYFAGRGIVTRLAMQRRGLRIGAATNVRLGLVALGLWGGTAIFTIVAAVRALAIG